MASIDEKYILNGDGTYSKLVASRGVDMNGISSQPTSTSRIPSTAATINATAVKTGPGRVFRATGNNLKAAVVYLKIYNKSGAPNPASDVPVLVIPIAASGIFDKGLDGFVLPTGISYLLTADAADTGSTALTAGDILNFSLSYA